MRPPLPLSLLSVALLSVAARAQQSPPPVDPAAVLDTIKDLKTKQKGVVAREKSQVFDSIRGALNDPAKAYEQAYLAVEVQGKGANEGTRMVEWRKQNADLLRDRAFINALRLELTYLSLTWQRHMGTKTRDLLPALYDYTAQVTAATDALGGFKMMDRTVGDSLFTKYFQVGPYIAGMPEWENRVFNVDGILEKTVLPCLRQDKDPRLLTYWDNKMQAEVARIDQRSNGLAINRFNNVRRPSLLWSRAEDELLLGDQPRAVADMLAILKGHADHPDFDKWAARLTEVVTPKPDSASSPAAGAPASAPR